MVQLLQEITRGFDLDQFCLVGRLVIFCIISQGDRWSMTPVRVHEVVSSLT
jgi:hypothetical protein